MREGIAKHSGYEIITEGDSFQVAFSSCQQAMAFCIETQYRLVEQTWSKNVLALNACRLIRGESQSPRRTKQQDHVFVFVCCTVASRNSIVSWYQCVCNFMSVTWDLRGCVS